MMVWSAVVPSINNREYCVYCIGNISLTKYRQNAYLHNVFQAFLASCGAVYCNRSCLCLRVYNGRAGGRAGRRCPNLTTASERSVCVYLAFFIVSVLDLERVFFLKAIRNY